MMVIINFRRANLCQLHLLDHGGEVRSVFVFGGYLLVGYLMPFGVGK